MTSIMWGAVTAIMMVFVVWLVVAIPCAEHGLVISGGKCAHQGCCR